MAKAFFVISLIYGGYFVVMLLFEFLKHKEQKVKTKYEETYFVSDLDVEETKNIDMLYPNDSTSSTSVVFEERNE